MDLPQLQYFVAVAEELHFGHAAEREHLTQAAVSQQVRRLERELRVTLLDRTTRRVHLTAAGRLFLDEARVVLARAERAVDTARRASNGEVGGLLVGYPVTGRGRLASEILRSFRQRFPGVTLTSVPCLTADLPEHLRHEQVDVAFIHHCVDNQQLTSRIIGRTRYALAMLPGHRLAAESAVSVEELAGECLLFFSRQLSPQHYDELMQELSGRLGGRPRIVEEASAVGDLIEGVEAGVGIALVTEPGIPEEMHGRVIIKQFRPPAPAQPLVLSWRRNDRSPALATFLRVVKDIYTVNLREAVQDDPGDGSGRVTAEYRALLARRIDRQAARRLA